MVNQTYKIHTFLSVLTDWVFGFTISLTFGIYKNLFPFLPHSIYIYIYIYISISKTSLSRLFYKIVPVCCHNKKIKYNVLVKMQTFFKSENR